MYESFYGLKEKPFSLLPDPAFLYLSRQHEMAITLLEYSLENQAGFCVITGKAGTGKTTLLRRLLNQIGDDVSIGLITNTHHSFGELLRWILHAFSLDDSANNRARQHQIFVDYLIAQYAKNRRTMLIIDEAQNMSAEALEELRMLSNINSEKDLLLQVILVGQPPLREVLRRPELEQFAQRVAVDYHLDSLSSEETRGYIRHRLRVAGGEHELFTDDACEAVFVHSSGIPRLINLLCDLALVYAYAAQAAVVTGELIEQIVSEREKHGALPIFAASQESRVVQRPLLKHAQSSAAAGMSETVSTRAVRHAAARRLGGDVEHVTVAEQKSAVSPERPDVSGKDRAHVVKRATVEEIQKPLATPRAATVVQDAQAMFALDASPDGRTVQEAAPAPVTDVQAGKNIVSVAPVVTEMVLHNGVASEVSPEVNKLGVTDNSHRHSPGRPRDSKLVDARPVKDRKPGSMGMALRRGVTDRLVLARRYVPAMIMILMMFAAVLAWLSLGQPNLTMAFSGQASPARVAAAIPAAERKPVASEPTSALPSANQSVSGTLPMQQAVAESHMAGKKAAEEARLKQIQRERDAALAIAAAAARERETLRNAALARERVLATEHEAVLARERERAKQLTQAVEMAILQAHDAEMAAEAKAAEPVMPTPTMKAEAAPVIKVVGGDLSPQKAGVEDATKTGVSETTTFAANPCKGPSARFLSTCE